MKKFMKAIEDVLSFIGASNVYGPPFHWEAITWHELDPMIDQKRSGNERRDTIKKVPKKVKAKRKSTRRK